MKNKQDVYCAIEKKIQSLKEQHRFGSAKVYGDMMSSLKKFSPELEFTDITVDFLKRYENYIIVKRQLSPTTLGIYLRCLRSIINDAIADGLMPKSRYPFGREREKRYEIPSARTTKKALTDIDIRKIIDYEPKSEGDARARDMWLFTYYCNGINMADILRLQFKNIYGDFFSFYREKTKRTRKEQVPVQVYITPQIQAIINQWGNPDKSQNSYIFNFIDWNQNPEKIYKDINQVIHVVNNKMKHIGKELGINATLTTYAARHSFGTMLMRKGVSTAYISKSYGHASFATTNHYLGEFTDEQKMDYSMLLTQV